MAEMVDRVAAALRDACLQRFGKAWEMPTAQQFAILAITAMKEPTEAMKQAGTAALPLMPFKEQGGSVELPINPEPAWQAMISAALK